MSVPVVRVCVETADGSTHTREYVVDPRNVEIQSYAEWAVGNLIALITSGYDDTLDFESRGDTVELISQPAIVGITSVRVALLKAGDQW